MLPRTVLIPLGIWPASTRPDSGRPVGVLVIILGVRYLSAGLS